MVILILILTGMFVPALSCAAEDSPAAFRIITEEFPPYNYTSADGELQGISTEIVREILKRLDRPDTFEILPWSEGYRIAQEENNIILFSTTRSPMREKLFKWVGPLVPNNLVFFARHDTDITITSLDEAKKVKRIGVYKDDFGELLLREKGFDNLASEPQNILNIPKLLSGEIDLWIANELTGKHMAGQLDAGNKIKKVFDVQKGYMYLAFSRSTPDSVIVHWQRILDEIKHDGTYAQIFSKWIMFSYTSDLEPEAEKTVQLSDEEKQWIDHHPVIRVAPDPDYAPFQFRGEDGRSKGVADDFLALIRQKLGIRFKLLDTTSWDDSLRLVKKHQADLVAVATPTAERREYMLFTQPYVKFPDVIISRKSHAQISSLDDLAGQSVVSVKGFAINHYLAGNHPEITLLLAPDVKSAIESVSMGAADATVLNLATTSYTIEKWKVTNLRVNAMTGFSYELALGVRKDWPMLRQILEKGLAAIGEDEKQEVLRRWIAISPDSATDETKHITIDLTHREQDWLQAHPEIRIGVDPDYPPFDFVGEDGLHQGVASDYVRLISQRLGVKLKVVSGLSWSQVLEGVQNGSVDVVPLLGKTAERTEYLNFSEPYLSFPNVIITRDNHKFITGLAEFGEGTMAVVKRYANTENLARRYPAIKRHVVTSPLEGLNAVATGEADGYVGNLGVTGYLIQVNGLTNLKIAAPTDLENPPFRIGVRQDWPELVPILNKALASITEEDRIRISRKWISVTDERPIDYALIWRLAAGMGVVLVLVSLWTLQVQRQKRALRESEENLRKARDAAEEANRAKSVFFANMSHEIRTPLNAILGFSGIIGRDEKLSEESLYNLGIIKRSGEHLLSIINDVLDMAKIESGRITLNEQRFEFEGLLKDIEDMFSLKAMQAGVTFSVTRNSPVPRFINGDEYKLKQVLINVLSNAFKFTPDGEIRLSVSATQDKEKSRIEMEISDTGLGIASDELETIFDAFVQSRSGRRSQKGTGLGMTISRDFIHLMGGDIEIRSKVGKGTSIRFFITAEALEFSRSEEKPSGRSVIGLAPGGPSKKILVVDDNETNRQLLVKILRSVQFNVMEAMNGKEAVDMAATLHPDLVFMDMRMPVMDGYQASRRIKGTDNGPVVIAVTADSDKSKQDVIFSAGCDDFIRKPFSEYQIFDAVKRHLGVGFIHEEVDLEELHRQPQAAKEFSLTGIPLSIIKKIDEALQIGDNERLLSEIDEVAKYNERAAKRLKALADEYGYDEILDLIRTNTKRDANE